MPEVAGAVWAIAHELFDVATADGAIARRLVVISETLVRLEEPRCRETAAARSASAAAASATTLSLLWYTPLTYFLRLDHTLNRVPHLQSSVDLAVCSYLLAIHR